MITIQFVLNPNTFKEESFKGLLQHCSSESKIAFECDEVKDSTTDETNFLLNFNTTKECKLFLFDFFYALNVPDHDFIDITKADFFIEAYDQDMINFINCQVQRSMQFDLELLDHICSDLAFDQTNMSERLDALENYVSKSGVIHYQQFMKELIDVLDAREILDKDSITEKMFQTTH